MTVTAWVARGMAVAALVAVTAGCGSTVALSPQGQAVGSSSGNLSVPGAQPSGGAIGTAPGTSGGPGVTDAASTGTGSGQTASVGGPGQGVGASAGGRTVVGPGVTATTITIGLVYFTNGKAFNEAIGVNGITNGDDVADVRILVNDINKHGGVAGRKLAILPYAEDATSTEPYAVTAQSMCSYMTQDHKVLGVILAGSLGDPKPCLNKAGTAVFDGNTLGLMDSDGKSQVDFASAAMNIDRSVLAAVQAWTVGDWYSPWDTSTGGPAAQGAFKMGILTIDEAQLNHAVDKVLIPALARAGHQPPAPQDIVRLQEPTSAGDDGSVLAAIQNSVLRFRQDGVTHVFIMDSNGSATLFFANDAYSQHYFPRLGGGTGNAFQTLLETGNIQQQSVVGAVGAGWIPLIDLPYDGSDRKYESTAAARCRALMKAGGQTFSDANAESHALGYCDIVTLIATALNRAPVLTAAGLAQGAETLGRSMASAVTPGLNIAPGHHDAAGAFYANVYNGSCGCFTYRGARELV